MAIQHYKGNLGEFDYDDKEFQLCSFAGCWNNDHYLHYVGNETDGSKINIPVGIVNCESMFSGCKNLRTPPVIPEGVENCDYMFSDSGLTGKKAIPIIPKSVKHTSAMCMHTSIERHYHSVIEWHKKHRGQVYNGWDSEIIIPNVRRLSFGGWHENEKNVYKGGPYGGETGCFTELGIPVPKSFSETGEARLVCSGYRLTERKSNVYDLLFDKDDEISVQVVGPGEDKYKGHIERLKVSELASLSKSAQLSQSAKKSTIKKRKMSVREDAASCVDFSQANDKQTGLGE